MISHGGGEDKKYLYKRGYSHKNRLRSSAWRVHNTPWEVIMYAKATAKRTRTLKYYYYYYCSVRAILEIPSLTSQYHALTHIFYRSTMFSNTNRCITEKFR